MIDFSALATDMGDLAEEKVLAAIRELVDNEPEQVPQALDALTKGMELVGDRFDSLEYFVGDLIFAGEVFTSAMELITPLFRADGPQRGKVILATVEGDLHDIGKNMVKAALEAKRFDVIDLGVNVSPAVIVKRTIEENASIVALSAVLTLALDAMDRTIQAFCNAGIRNKVSIVIGGAGVTAAVAREIGADAYAHTPDDTVAFCLAEEARRAHTHM